MSRGISIFTGLSCALFVTGMLLVCAQVSAADPVVSNVRARQLTDGTKRIEVLYDLSGAPVAGANVWILFSDDGGTTFLISPPPMTLSGQLGPGVRNGSDRRILWNVAASLPPGTFGTHFRARVSCSTGGTKATVPKKRN